MNQNLALKEFREQAQAALPRAYDRSETRSGFPGLWVKMQGNDYDCALEIKDGRLVGVWPWVFGGPPCLDYPRPVNWRKFVNDQQARKILAALA